MGGEEVGVSRGRARGGGRKGRLCVERWEAEERKLHQPDVCR